MNCGKASFLDLVNIMKLLEEQEILIALFCCVYY